MSVCILECYLLCYHVKLKTLLTAQATQPGPSNLAGLRFISGIIPKSKVLLFERMLFRATRGNLFFNQAPADDLIMDPVSSEMVCSPLSLSLSFRFYLCSP